MRFHKSKKDSVQQRAGSDAVIILQNWKRQVRRMRTYRLLLCGALSLCVLWFVFFWYYRIDGKVPSVLFLHPGEEQSLCLNIPAKAELRAVGVQGESNIPKGAVTIDLNSPLTIRTDSAQILQDGYTMEVKLFGFLPLKQISIRMLEEKQLIPVGVPVGIYMESDGIMVIGVGDFSGSDGKKLSPAKNILHSGDYIRKLNGVDMDRKETFMKAIAACNGEEQIITIERKGEQMDVRIFPLKDATGTYKIGAWIRDSTQGVGTMTYVDSDGNFGALGHGISDVDTNRLMKIVDGTLYKTQIVGIEKGRAGDPGEMTGMIVYSDENILGDIVYNGAEGVYGVCNQKAMNEFAGEEALPVGLKQELKKGKAQILCTVDGAPRYYDIEITDIHLDHDNVNRGIELKVTDKELLELTGGIIQGMSGSPIIQDGKLIGAVTHVLVNDSTRGYGIFIENMLEH